MTQENNKVDIYINYYDLLCEKRYAFAKLDQEETEVSFQSEQKVMFKKVFMYFLKQAYIGKDIKITDIEDQLVKAKYASSIAETAKKISNLIKMDILQSSCYSKQEFNVKYTIPLKNGLVYEIRIDKMEEDPNTGIKRITNYCGSVSSAKEELEFNAGVLIKRGIKVGSFGVKSLTALNSDFYSQGKRCFECHNLEESEGLKEKLNKEFINMDSKPGPLYEGFANKIVTNIKFVDYLKKMGSFKKLSEDPEVRKDSSNTCRFCKYKRYCLS